MSLSFVDTCAFKTSRDVQEQLLLGANVNSKDKYGLTGLMKAIVRNKTATVHMLLRRCDIDINIADLEGRCALHHAAWYDRGDIVTLLLADHRLSTVNMCCHDGGTPLLAAVDNNSIHSIKLL